MKFPYLISPLAFLSVASLIISCSGNEHKFPQPTDSSSSVKIPELMIEGEEDPDHSRKEAWFKEMHKAAPDVDWKGMDFQARVAKKQAHRTNKSRNSGLESFANGKLMGRWIEKGSNNQSGRIRLTAFDTINQNLYCLTDGGSLYQGKLDGSSWTPLNDQMRFSDPSGLHLIRSGNDLRIVVATAKGVLFSDDIGASWTEATGLSNVISWGSINKVLGFNDYSNVLYALVREWNYNSWNEVMSIYRSDDAGETFNLITESATANTGASNTHDIWTHYQVDSLCFYLRGNDLIQFNNNSNLFDTLSNSVHNGTSNALLTGQYNNNSLNFYVYADQEIYHSVDTTQTWQNTGNVGYNPFMRFNFNASLQSPGILYFGAVNTYVSYNSGTNWNLVNEWYEYYGDEENKLHADIPAITPHLNTGGSEFTLVSTDGGLFYSENHLSSVQNISLAGLNCSQYYSIYTDRNDTNNVYAGAQDQGFQRSINDNGGIMDFEQTISGDYAHLTSSDNGASLWFLYPGFVAYNANASTGIYDASQNFNGINYFWMPPMQAVPNQPNKTWLCGVNTTTNAPHIYEYTYNSGNISSNALSFDFTTLTSGQLSAIQFSPINPLYCFVLTNNGEVLKTTDGGNTFTRSTFSATPDPHYFYGNAIYASATDLGTIYVGGSGYSNPGVWVSHDTGNTFTPIVNNIPSTLFYDLVGDPTDSILFAATELGPYAYVVSDDEWYAIQGESPDQICWSVEFLEEQQKARFGTYGRGIWDFQLIDTSAIGDTTGIDPNYGADLFQIYPNPFATEIHLDLKEIAKKVDVQIYTLNGQLIVEQVQNNTINIVLDLSKLETGTYVVKLNSDGQQQVKKILKINP